MCMLDDSPSGSRSLVTPYSLSMMWKARSILSLTSLLSTCRQSSRSGLKWGNIFSILFINYPPHEIEEWQWGVDLSLHPTII